MIEVPAFAADLSARFLQEPAYAFVGLVPTEMAHGRCVSEVAVRPNHLHHRGAVQGGLVAMIADATAGYAALTVLPEDAQGDDMATIEFKTSFLRPAAAERLICTSDVVHAGRSTVFAEARVFCDAVEDDRLCAIATLTFKRLVSR
ncbi:MAG: PaaI family thioesterase [Litorimonas sp.]